MHHVWEEKRSGGKLYKHLMRRGKKRNSRGSGYSGRGHIPGRITERPQIVEDKRRVGDWEADTIVGAGHRGALVSVVDRAKFLLHPVSSRSAEEVGQAMMERLMPYVEIVHTITSDNGKPLQRGDNRSAGGGVFLRYVTRGRGGFVSIQMDLYGSTLRRGQISGRFGEMK